MLRHCLLQRQLLLHPGAEILQGSVYQRQHGWQRRGSRLQTF
jgi:hypothetical protein